MKKTEFPFRSEHSDLLGKINRPMAKVSIWSKRAKRWTNVWMIVDTGADYTILPRFLAKVLKIDLEKDCKQLKVLGVAGRERVFFLPKIKVKLGKWERAIPVGLLDSNRIPPLMGRHLFLETFNTSLLKNKKIVFGI